MYTYDEILHESDNFYCLNIFFFEFLPLIFNALPIARAGCHLIFTVSKCATLDRLGDLSNLSQAVPVWGDSTANELPRMCQFCASLWQIVTDCDRFSARLVHSSLVPVSVPHSMTVSTSNHIQELRQIHGCDRLSSQSESGFEAGLGPCQPTKAADWLIDRK